jgi:hypothetical protein
MNTETSEKSPSWGSHAAMLTGAARLVSSRYSTRPEFAPLRAHRPAADGPFALRRAAHRAEDVGFVERGQGPDDDDG